MRTILFLVLIFTVLSFSEINVKFASVLNGEIPLTKSTTRDIYYNHFNSHYGKSVYRFKIFEKTLEEVIAHNKRNETWEKGINQFSDMTWLEFKDSYLMAPQNCFATQSSLRVEEREYSYPSSFEWNDRGMITPVKSQGQCAAGWAFAAVASLESYYRRVKSGSTQLYSQQQLIDCSGSFNNEGCKGGLASQAYQYIKSTGGLQLSETYQYVARQSSCKFSSSKAAIKIKSGSYNLTAGSESEIAEVISSASPVSLGFQVIDGFKDYKSGVYNPQTGKCGTKVDDVNHIVLATGYGTEIGTQYWNAKNSWGVDWGNKGYFMIARGKNACAVSQCNSYPLQPYIE